MKNKFLLTITFLLIALTSFAQEKKSFLETEMKIWVQHLIDNGDLFDCSENQNDSIDFLIDNITFIETDINHDGVKDGFFYSRYDTCGGNGNFSDSAMFIISANGKYSIDKEFTQTVIDKIKRKLNQRKQLNVENVGVKFSGVGNAIIGEFDAWMEDDLSGFPTYRGNFEYYLNKVFIELKTNKY